MAGTATITRLSEALHRLTPEQRRVVHLTGFEGFTAELTAMLTGSSKLDVLRHRASGHAALADAPILPDSGTHRPVRTPKPEEGQTWEPLAGDPKDAFAGRVVVLEVYRDHVIIRRSRGAIEEVSTGWLTKYFWPTRSAA